MRLLLSRACANEVEEELLAVIHGLTFSTANSYEYDKIGVRQTLHKPRQNLGKGKTTGATGQDLVTPLCL